MHSYQEHVRLNLPTETNIINYRNKYNIIIHTHKELVFW